MAKVRFCTLFSGSSANSAYIEIGGKGILIDAGAGVRKLGSALQSIGSGFDKIQAIFVTHEHTDHICGLSTVLKNHRIPVLAAPATLRGIAGACGDVDRRLLCAMNVGAKAVNGDFEVTSFASSHDCPQSVGYVVNAGGIKLGILTDTGFVSQDMLRAVSECRALVLESNHDLDMLRTGRYPAMLKARILSERGHLSNVQCAETLCRLAGNTEHVFLAHLSRENNLPELALKTVTDTLEANGIGPSDIRVEVAPALVPSAVVEYDL